ncbi:hypothetical protein G5V57_12045 [Nordella sp. HKS 07]|uniref:DUF5681 domain-containing protein n=1 Tax=Nordella sp. HKS 07 TaxID=2712222 RepID=UPI0013E143F6|nr:DUF5681 domain-containing protein [Nordella sp. HKS 07]QIG48392.1 hypothetical protein G5V57_12045 [Nordella sp. HKS 07]
MTKKQQPSSNRGWFQKGQSGNPGGRPRQRPDGSNSAFDIIINRTLKASRNGVPQEITVEEALQQRTYQEALAGKRMAIREVMGWIQKREQWLAKNEPAREPKVSILYAAGDPDNADQALVLLGIAREVPELYPHKGDNRPPLRLESWAVKAALRRRRGATALTKKDIEEIRRCTHDDGTLKLPEGVDK